MTLSFTTPRRFYPGALSSLLGDRADVIGSGMAGVTLSGPEHIREWHAYLLHKRKLAVGTLVARPEGLRFFFMRTLKPRVPPDSTQER
jgi:hypothetical protein